MPLRLLLLLLCFASLAAPRADDLLRVAADRWPPYADSRLPRGGVAVDLVRAALERAGYPSEYVEVPWPRVLHGVRGGEYDVVVDAWYSPDRETFGEFSEAYLSNRVRLLKRRGSPITFAHLADLYTYRIAVVRGYSYSTEFDGDTHLQRVPVLSFANAARMLQAGRVDLAVEDEITARHQFAGELAEARNELEFLPLPLAERGLHILVSRRNPQHGQIVEAFNKAIRAMHEDGSYDALMRAHGL
ncbi:transporter substrate-binding domain-containing protein [Pseudomonas sp. ZM23]|uniref:Transporter substrate-binding domain-containing protein n=1 Tax=Pseudomonas triclosanedens TaxID=2961893 RepID=A0ABY7A1U5_9PSED|nr:transporter substrate-binding domain-containing protein [Pseudomonas triclosanedens]MCP8462989.1 transporter substrate-binding domain-containing protein [Pseudomonas triclosanedens]MCP8468609.1 transporter substrate-binding domain-containing protein [Pseudomonas triclosanedens]MCP8475331.1 transporter substrate-binding domain-containing protein [Pseudomonas triclosanedens]WAI50163.1 transporter substrate-binding domain-containing protein [Pseudomonas triclosanedens]